MRSNAPDPTAADTTTAASHRPAPLRAITYKLASALVLAGMFALIKSLGSRYPIGEIVFARSLFALLPILWLLQCGGRWAVLRTAHPLAHLRRSVAGTASLFLSFAAVTLLPLSTATALTYAAPLFITVLSATMLRERVSLWRWLAVLAGFAGVLIVVQPDLPVHLSAGLPLGKVLGVLAAIATAVALIAIRQMPASESHLAIAFYFTVFGTLVGAATMAFDAVMPNRLDAFKLVAVGLLGGIAQVLLTQAYRLAPASLIAPFEYATLVSAILIGFVVWGDVPSPVEWIGIAVIIGANLALAMLEHATRVAHTRTSKRSVR